MQNLVRFHMTSKFDGEYLRNGYVYSKSDKYLIARDSSRVRQKKSDELWSSNHGKLKVKSYPPKIRKTIFRPLLGAVPQIFYTR